MDWLQVNVITTTEFADIVALVLSDYGSDGVSIKDFNDIKDVLRAHNWDYADESLFTYSDERVFVSGFFAPDFKPDALIEELDNYKRSSEIFTGSLETSFKIIKSQDWENEWRKYYSCIEIGKIVIVPQWLENKNKNLLEVRLDPGMAFGTGSHETTALCVKLMQEANLNDSIVADVGCGSGILGIAALKLGAKKCAFVDIDEQAIEATESNCKLNNIGKASAEIYKGNLLDEVNYKLDFVVANITANILHILLPDISAALKPGGKLVISGIINKFADEVYAAYSGYFTPLNRVNDGEWNAMLFEKAN